MCVCVLAGSAVNATAAALFNARSQTIHLKSLVLRIQEDHITIFCHIPSILIDYRQSR